MNAEVTYRCPGETYEISRSVHLGRLAGFYPACAACPHRFDTATFSTRRVKSLAGVHSRAKKPDSLISSEGFSGVYLNEIAPPTAQRIGQALGAIIIDAWTAREPPRVLIASDGRRATAELAAAASDGVRWAGCQVVDLGAATAPCLATVAARREAAASILVGNHHGSPREVSLSLGGLGGEPMSSPGTLDTVLELFHSPQTRRSQPFGRLEKSPVEVDYVDRLRPHYHALRPLRLVIDTTSIALLRYLKTLTSSVAVTIEGQMANPLDLPRLGKRVQSASAHFGIWIDGDGEACRAVDQRGAPVSVESLATLVVREAIEDSTATGGIEVSQQPNRESVRRAMLESGARFAADRHGRIWFGNSPAADALVALTYLFTLLSRDDRPLSEHVASAILVGES